MWKPKVNGKEGVGCVRNAGWKPCMLKLLSLVNWIVPAELFLDTNLYTFYQGTTEHDNQKKESYPDSAALSMPFFHAEGDKQKPLTPQRSFVNPHSHTFVRKSTSNGKKGLS